MDFIEQIDPASVRPLTPIAESDQFAIYAQENDAYILVQRHAAQSCNGRAALLPGSLLGRDRHAIPLGRWRCGDECERTIAHDPRCHVVAVGRQDLVVGRDGRREVTRERLAGVGGTEDRVRGASDVGNAGASRAPARVGVYSQNLQGGKSRL